MNRIDRWCDDGGHVDRRRAANECFPAPQGLCPSLVLPLLGRCAKAQSFLNARESFRQKPWIGAAAGPKVEGKMSAVLSEYLPLMVFMIIATIIGLSLLVAPFVVAYKQPDPSKLSAYECGFEAFDDARMKFDVRFYLVAILFIIFDLEVSFLFPWAVAFGKLGAVGFWSMIVFLAVLTIGFAYEWKKGALEWD